MYILTEDDDFLGNYYKKKMKIKKNTKILKSDKIKSALILKKESDSEHIYDKNFWKPK